MRITTNWIDPEPFHQSLKYSNLQFLPDYSLIEVEGMNILSIGGAISIDRSRRTDGITYWKDEAFSYSERKLAQHFVMLPKLI